MGDNEKEPNEFEEEFEFDAEDDSFDESLLTDELTEAAPATTEAKVVKAKGPSKLPLIIGIIIAGFVGWKLYQMIFLKESAEPTEITQPPAPTPTETKPIEIPAPPQIDADTTKEVQPIVTDDKQLIVEEPKKEPEIKPVSEEKLEKSIEELQIKGDDTAKRIKMLEDSLNKLTESMDNFSKGIGKVDHDINAISDVVKKLTIEVKKLKDVSKPKPIKEAYVDEEKEKMVLQTKKIFADPIYSVHAIIPGRAWLRSKDGKTITVTEGDMIDKYGKVLVIDAPSGVVITSSGVTLR